MSQTLLSEAVSRQVWQDRYRYTDDGHRMEPDIGATWDRVAQALAAPEAHQRDLWQQRFRHALAQFRFLPGGRILAAAGTGRQATLFNCFAAGTLPDSVGGVFGGLGEAMQTLQAGGGIGCDFSTLRPAGAPAAGADGHAAGPVAYLPVWDAASAALTGSSARGGAMMATLRCDHPDIERFIDAKRQPGALPHFNLSVLVSDAFMEAVEHDQPWRLVFPVGEQHVPPGGAVCERIWPGGEQAQTCLVYRTVGARELWQRLQRAAFDTGDPGVIFIDRVARADNLYYCERIAATNPCGEVPLPAHGACNLGSINAAAFVTAPFGAAARLDLEGIADCTALAVRMLDNVYELGGFPLHAQARVARASRRIGLGLTGLADAMAMLGVRYGSPAANELAVRIMKQVCHAAYRSSVALARERGSFPAFDAQRFLAGEFVARLPPEIRAEILRDGIRNSHLTALAPAGSISLLANNVSSGIEPIFTLEGFRPLRSAGGKRIRLPVRDFAWCRWQAAHGAQAQAPAGWVTAAEVPAQQQLELQAMLQDYVDQAIAKTVLLPPGAHYEPYRDLFAQAYCMGLKGCTLYQVSARPHHA